MRWFRLHTKILHDPKVQLLDPAVFKIYINCLCYASERGENGNLGKINETAFALHETESSVSSAFHALEKVGLIVTDGETFHIPQWRKKQYKSDTSTERVKKHRQKVKRCRNVTVTPPDTDTDTDTDNPPNPPLNRPEQQTEKFARLLKDCFAAAELDPAKIINPKIHTGSTQTVRDWLDAGGDFEDHIKPTIREALNAGRMSDPGFHPATLKYYRQAVLERIAKAKPEDDWEDTETPQWRIRVAHWQKTRKWRQDLWEYPPDHPDTRVPPKILAEFGIIGHA